MSKIPNNKTNQFLKKTLVAKEIKINKKPLLDKDKVEKMAQERIIQKNVVYIIGLSYKLANKEVLQKHEYFGQYGKITKILTNKIKGANSNAVIENCYSSYIYYSSPAEAALAILAVDNFKLENNFLKTSFGRTKYCSYFLRNLECLNKDCFYLHKPADKDDVITREDSKLLFHEQHIQAIKMTSLLDPNFKKKILADDNKKNFESVFPKISSIYNKPIFMEYQEELNKQAKSVINYKNSLNTVGAIGSGSNNSSCGSSDKKNKIFLNNNNNDDEGLEYDCNPSNHKDYYDDFYDEEEKNKQDEPKQAKQILKLSDILKSNFIRFYPFKEGDWLLSLIIFFLLIFAYLHYS